MQGVLGGQALPLRQTFHQLPAASTREAADARFDHFARSIWLSMKDSGALGLTLICQHFHVLSHFSIVAESLSYTSRSPS